MPLFTRRTFIKTHLKTKSFDHPKNSSHRDQSFHLSNDKDRRLYLQLIKHAFEQSSMHPAVKKLIGDDIDDFIKKHHTITNEHLSKFIQELTPNHVVLNHVKKQAFKQLSDYQECFSHQRYAQPNCIIPKNANRPFKIVVVQGEHYVMQKQLGKGFCGVAKKAMHLESGQSRVVKTIKPFIGGPIGKILLRSGYNESDVLKELRQGGEIWERKLNLDIEQSAKKNFRAVVVGEEIITVQNLQKGAPLDNVIENIKSDPHHANTYEVLLAIGEGMQDLHHKGIYHGDIKLQNILYDNESKKANYIDFGLSYKVDKNGTVDKKDQEIVMYPAPSCGFRKRQVTGIYQSQSTEWKNGERLTLKTDVFALGKVFKEFARKCGIHDPQLDELINDMLKDRAKDRVDIDKVVHRLEELKLANENKVKKTYRK